MRNIHIFAGGTIYHVRPHLALAAPAYGEVGRMIERMVNYWPNPLFNDCSVKLHLTKMAANKSKIETNEDVERVIDQIVADPTPSIVFMGAALCDFTGDVGEIVESIDWGVADPRRARPEPGFRGSASGKDQPRLKTSEGVKYLRLTPAEKVLRKIRKTRKDIFLVGFKTTAGVSPEEQFKAGLALCKQNSCNLVLANDVHTRLNMVITPEEAPYHVTDDREAAISGLVEMAGLRSKLRFTRSTVVDGELVRFDSPEVPEALRTVVSYCIERGAYKPFEGKTVGHFAFKLKDGEFVTSIRRSNFNTDLKTKGMVRIQTVGEDSVVAYGARPSVGGQSQRSIFTDHKDLDSIVHFHCPLKKGVWDVPVVPQRPYECGSHECGQNTSQGLKAMNADGTIKAVMLDKHGPNIVFNRNVDPQHVIKFIEDKFDLQRSTSEIA
jgi:hypothetical protein